MGILYSAFYLLVWYAATTQPCSEVPKLRCHSFYPLSVKLVLVPHTLLSTYFSLDNHEFCFHRCHNLLQGLGTDYACSGLTGLLWPCFWASWISSTSCYILPSFFWQCYHLVAYFNNLSNTLLFFCFSEMFSVPSWYHNSSYHLLMLSCHWTQIFRICILNTGAIWITTAVSYLWRMHVLQITTISFSLLTWISDEIHI